MRRLLLLAGLLAGLSLSFTSPLRAQEGEQQKIDTESEDNGIFKWQLINTGIFVLILGYAAIKMAPKFFNARSLDIQKAIKEATGLKIDADFRYSEIDKKMANLSGEVAKLRTEAKAAMDREHERMRKEAEEEMAHLRGNMDAEMDALQKDGVRQVKVHTAQLAIGLAERRLQTYFAEGKITDNFDDFVHLLEQTKN